jgi:hypothetical protein
MGAQASTNKVKTSVEINNEAINKCGSTTITNAVLLKKAKVMCPKDCRGKCKFNINQGAAVDATCLIKAHQDSLSETIAAMDAKTKTGLGFGASTNVSDMRKELNNKIQSECAGASSAQKIDASEMQLEMCDVTFAQNATAKNKCELGALQAMRDKTETQAKAATEGFDPAAFIKAYSTILIAIAGIIALVIIVFIAMSFSGGKDSVAAQAISTMERMQTGGGGMGDNDIMKRLGRGGSPQFEFGRRHRHS